jgi:N-acetylglucosaminyldiphosphoundecaprenol N-acetyl-beta-D-mannosaminyltransferase
LEHVDILGVKVNLVTMPQSLDIIEDFINSKTPHLVVTLGTEMTMMAQKDMELKKVINNAHLIVPDTAGIVWSTKFLHKKTIKKVAGIELLENLIERGSKKNYTFYFLGSQEGIAKKAAENLVKLFPSLKVLGTHNGYFRGKDEEVIEEINRLKPDILVIAMGVPYQEKWTYKNMEKLNVPVCIGVGGSFDVISGKLDRAPGWMIKLNIEWLYRLYREPTRAIRMLALPHFVLLVFKKKFFY